MLKETHFQWNYFLCISWLRTFPIKEPPRSRGIAATPVGLRARQLAEPSTPLWYMLIAITPRVRYRAGARCPAWRATELRQLCANLLNSNLTGSHLPPLVRAARPYLVRQVVPPGIELYRRSETARGCTRSCAGGRMYLSVYVVACVCALTYIFACLEHAKSGKAFVERNKLPPRVLKWYFTNEGKRRYARAKSVQTQFHVQEDY